MSSAPPEAQFRRSNGVCTRRRSATSPCLSSRRLLPRLVTAVDVRPASESRSGARMPLWQAAEGDGTRLAVPSDDSSTAHGTAEAGRPEEARAHRKRRPDRQATPPDLLTQPATTKRAWKSTIARSLPRMLLAGSGPRSSWSYSVGCSFSPLIAGSSVSFSAAFRFARAAAAGDTRRHHQHQVGGRGDNTERAESETSPGPRPHTRFWLLGPVASLRPPSWLCSFLPSRLCLCSAMTTRKLGKYIMLETLGQGGFSKSVEHAHTLASRQRDTVNAASSSSAPGPLPLVGCDSREERGWESRGPLAGLLTVRRVSLSSCCWCWCWSPSPSGCCSL